MMCKLDPYYLVNYNKMCKIYFIIIGKRSDMLNDVDFVPSICKHTSSPRHRVKRKLAEKREAMYNAR